MSLIKAIESDLAATRELHAKVTKYKADVAELFVKFHTNLDIMRTDCLADYDKVLAGLEDRIKFIEGQAPTTEEPT